MTDISTSESLLILYGEAAAFNGKPFSGATVGAYFGNQGAAIKALAEILALILLEGEEVKTDG